MVQSDDLRTLMNALAERASPAPAVVAEGWQEKIYDAMNKAFDITERRGNLAEGALTISDTQLGVEFAVEKIEAMLAAAPLAAQAPVKLEDFEQYRMQMAGISTAALGYWKEGESIHPDYDTTALRDVAKLYAKYAALVTPSPDLQAGQDARDAALRQAKEALENVEANKFGAIDSDEVAMAIAAIDAAMNKA